MKELIILITEYGMTKHEKYLPEQKQGQFNTLRTGLLNCLYARSRGLIQSEVRFL